MLVSTSNFIKAIENSFSIAQSLLLTNALAQVASEKESLLQELNEEVGIKVPIVGDFNAGKSSMVNALLGRNGLLPVNITPETAVAYEMYYSTTEKVELYRKGIKVLEQSVDAIKQLTVQPGDVAKVYVNAPAIRDLQEKGIILVDMPGIDSGIKEHNDAILHYINKGSAFILVTDSEQGSLRESTVSFITELSKYNLKPAVLISKIDKKPESEVKDIREYVEFQAKRAIGDQTFVGCVSAANNNLADFTSFLSTLDSNSLVSMKFSNRVASFIKLQIVSITAQKDILSANIENVEAKINKLEEEKQRLSKQLAESVPYADTPEKSTQDILDAVKTELSLHAELIATKVVNKEDSNTINAMMMNFIRPVVINTFKEEGQQYASAMNTAVDDVSKALQDTLTIEGNFVDGIVEDMRGEIVGGVQLAAEALMFMGPLGRVFGFVLSMLGEKIPDIIRWIFGKSKETVIAEATEMINMTIIDKVAESLRPVMLQQVEAQQTRIRENIKNKIANSISSIQDSVRASSEKGSAEELTTRIAEMDKAVSQLLVLKNSL